MNGQEQKAGREQSSRKGEHIKGERTQNNKKERGYVCIFRKGFFANEDNTQVTGLKKQNEKSQTMARRKAVSHDPIGEAVHPLCKWWCGVNQFTIRGKAFRNFLTYGKAV